MYMHTLTGLTIFLWSRVREADWNNYYMTDSVYVHAYINRVDNFSMEQSGVPDQRSITLQYIIITN